MEFGKVDSQQLARIDFRLPAEDPRTRQELSGTRAPQLRIGIGCPVWGVKDWLGKVYPLDAGPSEFLYHYSRQFSTIELNTTHYRLPDGPTISRWRSETPEGFLFCPKFLQEISHRHPLGANEALLKSFVGNLMGLEDRLGISFLQLPPTFSPHDLGELASFLAKLPREFPIAVEVRHPEFFEAGRLSPALYDLLAAHGAHALITDVAGRRDVLHASLTSKRALARFIGNDLHPSDFKRIDAWIERIGFWVMNGLEQIEFFVHEPEDRNAPDLVTYLVQGLNAKLGLDLKSWRPMNRGEQLGLF